MPLGVKDKALLAEALGTVTGLSHSDRKDIKQALKSLPSLSALTGTKTGWCSESEGDDNTQKGRSASLLPARSVSACRCVARCRSA